MTAGDWEPDAQEIDFRRRWHEAHVARFIADAGDSSQKWREENLTPQADQARAYLDALRRTRNLNAFQSETNRWTQRFPSNFGKFNGQMIVNQINKRSEDPEADALLLSDVLSVPLDLDDAQRKIRTLADHLAKIKVGSSPNPGNAPFVASFYWSLLEPDLWPAAWPKSFKYVEYSTGNSEFVDQGFRYAELHRFATDFGTGPRQFEKVAAWWAETSPVFVDVVLCDRSAFGTEEQSSIDTPALAAANARVMVNVAKHIGDSLISAVTEQSGLLLKIAKPPLYWTKGRPRGDLWIDWKVPETYGVAVRLRLNADGLAIGLRPHATGDAGDTQSAVAIIEANPLEGYELFSAGRSNIGRDIGFVGGGTGEVMYGRWFDRLEIQSLNLEQEVLQTAQAVAPLMRKLVGGTAETLPPEEVHEPDDAILADEEHVTEVLEELSDRLLVDRDFIDDVVALLEDKKQIVFYGPPGTGKTYFAKALTEALTNNELQRPVVQFHPSTSYEDFFEGYRPETDSQGSMTYRLQPGPLARLAARATASPDEKHVMIIDEINRANLPKVLGEMLFLFEYRDTPVQTLYRPEEAFTLPENIWFIGTMNTADRSIALVDAALRRRFHFIPFFPNHGPMEGLLDRWLDREGEPEWVGRLVAQVNDELEKELGGPHLQLGPSYFMKKGLDKDSLRRIWEYNIEPFIEDQFFGDSARIERFRFPSVWNRFNDLSGESVDPAAEA